MTISPRALKRKARPRLGFEPAHAGVHELGQPGFPEVEREISRVDPCELEEIVDENREPARLLLERRETLVDRNQSVLGGFDHRLDGGDGRPEVVARRDDELAPGIEELLEVRRHLVERTAELCELARAADGRAHVQVSRRDEIGGGSHGETLLEAALPPVEPSPSPDLSII